MTNADVVRAFLLAETLKGWTPDLGPVDSLFDLPDVSLAGDTVVIAEGTVDLMGRDVLTPRSVITFLPSGREFSVVSDYPSAESPEESAASPVFRCLREAVAWAYSQF